MKGLLQEIYFNSPESDTQMFIEVGIQYLSLYCVQYILIIVMIIICQPSDKLLP